jgi:hypothetical protein
VSKSKRIGAKYVITILSFCVHFMHKSDSAARHSVAPTASKIHVKRDKGVKKIKYFFQRPAVSVGSVRSWWCWVGARV